MIQLPVQTVSDLETELTGLTQIHPKSFLEHATTVVIPQWKKLFYPNGFQGTASVGATQELVDAFPMANGRPISDPLSGYDPLNPYVGRDPRFYSTVFYNTAKANRNNVVTSPMYTFECWNAPIASPGKDAAGTKSDNNLTNYYIKKFVFMGWNPSDATVVSTYHSKFLIRYHKCYLHLLKLQTMQRWT